MGGTYGDTIFDSTYRSHLFPQKNSATVDWFALSTNSPDKYGHEHVAREIMGDPTLRLFTVPPPKDVHVIAQGGTNDLIAWTASSDPNILGYQVLYSNSKLGPFTNAHSGNLTNTAASFLCSNINNIYAVRALRLETVTNSGSYINSSEAVMNLLRFRDAYLTNSDSQITFELVGPVGLSISVESSSDMASWSARESFSITNGSVTKTYTATNSAEFFRARTSNNSDFSDNIIGYYHIDMPGTNGWRIIANQLNQFGAGGNAIDQLIPSGVVPNNTKIYKIKSDASYDTYTYSPLSHNWTPSGLVLNPGDAVWIQKGAAQSVTLSFCGEVPQGNLRAAIPAWHYAMNSSMRAFSANVTNIVRTLAVNSSDQIQYFDYSTQVYSTTTWSPLSHYWTTSYNIPLGDGFFIYRPNTYPQVNWDEFFTGWPDL